MRSNIIESYKKTLKLNDLQKEVLIGLLMGDGHLESRDGRIYRLKIEHSYLQKEYVDWLYNIFREWVLTPPQEKIQTLGRVQYKKFWFSTVSHGAFRFYGQQFYRENKKILPQLIHKWLSPLVMAVWFMDDGSIKSNRHRALILNTQSFSVQELQRLIKVLKEKYGVEMKLRKQSRKSIEIYQLITVGDTVEKFVQVIGQYTLPSMRYKLGKLGTQLPKK